MHELSIAQSIIETVQHEMTARAVPAVTEIGLRIGVLSGVLPDALEFGFEALIAETPLEGCRLEIEHVPAQGQCLVCEKVFEVEEFFFSCPVCASGQVRVTQGYELDIAYLEVEEEEHPVLTDA